MWINILLVRENKHFVKVMVKIQAAETEMSWLLVSRMGHTPKFSGSYIPHDVIDSMFFLDPPCLLNAHIFQTRCVQFLLQI